MRFFSSFNIKYSIISKKQRYDFLCKRNIDKWPKSLTIHFPSNLFFLSHSKHHIPLYYPAENVFSTFLFIINATCHNDKAICFRQHLKTNKKKFYQSCVISHWLWLNNFSSSNKHNNYFIEQIVLKFRFIYQTCQSNNSISNRFDRNKQKMTTWKWFFLSKQNVCWIW